jgi:hypothetical protein
MNESRPASAEHRPDRPKEPSALAVAPDRKLRGPVQLPGEVDGPTGPEPTRYGDWERGGRCSDF